MENKLTLEHLSAYLPYGLRMIFEGKGGREITLSSITGQGKYGVVISGGTSTGPMWLNSCRFKPILRPLSDLTKEIEHNGERFIPYAWIENEFDLEDFGNNLEYLVKREDDGNVFISLSVQYEIIKNMFEWHFDVFGLIDKGLAVDINTLKGGK